MIVYLGFWNGGAGRKYADGELCVVRAKAPAGDELSQFIWREIDVPTLEEAMLEYMPVPVDDGVVARYRLIVDPVTGEIDPDELEFHNRARMADAKAFQARTRDALTVDVDQWIAKLDAQGKVGLLKRIINFFTGG